MNDWQMEGEQYSQRPLASPEQLPWWAASSLGCVHHVFPPPRPSNPCRAENPYPCPRHYWHVAQPSNHLDATVAPSKLQPNPSMRLKRLDPHSIPRSSGALYRPVFSNNHAQAFDSWNASRPVTGSSGAEARNSALRSLGGCYHNRTTRNQRLIDIRCRTAYPSRIGASPHKESMEIIDAFVVAYIQGYNTHCQATSQATPRFSQHSILSTNPSQYRLRKRNAKRKYCHQPQLAALGTRDTNETI
jgi:hypothetical protein